MGSFNENLKQTKKSLEISKRLLNNAIAEEKEAIAKLNKTDYLNIYKIKEHNRPLVESISKTITDLYAKLKKDYQLKSDNSRFALYNIGPVIAKLLSEVEQENYSYQIVDYKGTSYYQDHLGIGTIDYNGTCYVVSKNDYSKTHNQLVEDNNVGDFNMGKETVCLSTSGFNLPPIVYEEKVCRIPRTDKFDSSIQFYNDENKPMILFKQFPYIYDFIDMAIDRKLLESKKYLTISEFDDIIAEFLKNRDLEKPMNLKKVK